VRITLTAGVIAAVPAARSSLGGAASCGRDIRNAALGLIGAASLFAATSLVAASLVFQLSIRSEDHQGAARVLRAKQGDQIAIEWSADKPQVVHIHPYEIEQELVPGKVSRNEFTATISGRFPIEAHPGARGGRRIVGYLEVLPR